MIEEIGRALDLATLTAELGGERLALLESGGPVGPNSRFTILALDPSAELVGDGRGAVVRSLDGAETLAAASSVLEAIGTFLAGRRREPPPQQIPFAGGLVGYLGYEVLHEIEPIVERSAAPSLGLPEAHLLAFETAIVCDRLRRRSWVCAPVELIDSARERAAAAPTLPEAPPSQPPAPLGATEMTAAGIISDTSAERYFEMVERTKELIRAGDVFELCLTRRFDAHNDSPALHNIVREVTPAPMSALLRLRDDAEIISASPERLVRLAPGGFAETRPIKGTRPRGADAVADSALRADLLGAPKDRAEHVMIVDVARNDLGRVCEPGTIEVADLMAIEAHPTLWQMVSTVRGRLRHDCEAVDLIRAVFPAASMTGAPKIQAMRLIGAMERSRRGVYSGAIGYLDYGGAMDLSVVIRAIVRQGDRVTFHAGGAITADSDPVAEEQETLDKAAALVNALTLSTAST